MLIYPLGGILIVGAMMCAVNPVMGMINTATTDWLNALGGSSKVLLGAIVAGMMSVDMGGPVNKAAYVFGTAALASGNYEVMAAVMVGGMVPPIAIALSTTFCPRKWTLDERRNGIVNYVMGLCFVSEGAIPYAAADPLRVLPSCVVGSAVAGALSMTFGCALRAPHGGIFVFPVVDHAALYCVALAVGSVLGAVILSLVKRPSPPRRSNKPFSFSIRIVLHKSKGDCRTPRQSPLRFAQAPFSQKTGQYTAQNGLSCRNCVQRFVLHCTPPRAVVYLYS